MPIEKNFSNLKSYDILDRPKEINPEKVKWLERPVVTEKKNLVIIFFKCKEDCKTILTIKHLREMKRFMNMIQKDPLWSKLCVR